MGRRAPKRVRPSLNPSVRVPASTYPSIVWREPLTRDCPRCGREFIIEPPPDAKATASNATYCPECREPHKKERRHDYYLNVELPDIDRVYELHNAARAERCPPKIISCVICGKMFRKRHSAITCSPGCSRQNKVAYREGYDEKNRDAVNRKRREKWRANRDEINAARRERRARKKARTGHRSS